MMFRGTEIWFKPAPYFARDLIGSAQPHGSELAGRFELHVVASCAGEVIYFLGRDAPGCVVAVLLKIGIHLGLYAESSLV